MQYLWEISIYLEAVAIVPQLIVLQRYREVENLTGHYVFLLGAYRALYIVNWVYRSYHETYYKHNWVVYICGIIQTCLYVDFFYYYVQRCVRGPTLVALGRTVPSRPPPNYPRPARPPFELMNVPTHLMPRTRFPRSKYRGGKFALPN